MRCTGQETIVEGIGGGTAEFRKGIEKSGIDSKPGSVTRDSTETIIERETGA